MSWFCWSWYLIKWFDFSPWIMLILCQFWLISCMYSRCLIEILKGENEHWKNLRLNLMWYYLRKGWKISGFMIILLSWFSFDLMKVSKNLIKKNLLHLERELWLPFYYQPTNRSIEVKSVTKLTHYEALCSSRCFQYLILNFNIRISLLQKLIWTMILFSKERAKSW